MTPAKKKKSGKKSAKRAPVLGAGAAAALKAFNAIPAKAFAAANVVTVWPGGKTFPAIQPAIASITDASEKMQYQVVIGPGQYPEQVTMKPYVFLAGAGQDKTIISHSAVEYGSRGTIIGAPHSGLFDLTSLSSGGSWGLWGSGLYLRNCPDFHIQGVSLIAQDNGQAGVNLNALDIDRDSSGSNPTTIDGGSSLIQMTATSDNSTGTALNAANNAKVEILLSKIQAQGGMQAFGACSWLGADVLLQECYIKGDTWALYLTAAQPAKMTAENCQIDGAVSPGVVIKNT